MDKVLVAGFRGIVAVLMLAGLAACGSESQDSNAGVQPAAEQPQTQEPVTQTPPVEQPSTPNVQPSTPTSPPATEEPAPVVEEPVEPTEPVDPVDANAAPQIAGSPAEEVVVGQAFNFTPTATDADGDDLTFSITSKPSWASFDASTGRLWGTPSAGDVGSHEEITISVSDGAHTEALPQFAINVVQQANGNVTIVWNPPTQNTDGSALTNLKGYKIHYGTAPGTYDQVVTVNNAGLTRYVIENLAPGTYFFAISAINLTGAESELSDEANKTI